jgi:hypothetical protein
VFIPFGTYLSWPEGSYNVLSYVLFGLDLGSMSRQIQLVSAQTLDIALSLIALVLAIRWVQEDNNSRYSTLFLSFIIATMVLTHHLLTVVPVIVCTVIYCVFQGKSQRIISLIVGIVCGTLLLDASFGLHFIGHLINYPLLFTYYFDYAIPFTIIASLGIILLVGVLVFYRFTKSEIWNSWVSFFKHLYSELYQTVTDVAKKYPIASVILGLVILVGPFVFLWWINDSSSVLQFILRSGAPSLIILITLQVFPKKKPIQDASIWFFAGFWALSCVIAAVPGLFLPQFLPTSSWTSRILEGLSLSLLLLASANIVSWIDLNLRDSNGDSEGLLKKKDVPVITKSRIGKRKIVTIVLVVTVITTGFLSSSNFVEYYYLSKDNRGILTAQEVEAHEWIIEHTERNETLLTYSELSQLYLESSTQRKVLSYHAGVGTPMTWSMELLFTSKDSSTTLEILAGLSIKYAVLFTEDLNLMKSEERGENLLLILQSMEVVVGNEQCTIYRVSSIQPTTDSSIHVIQSPTFPEEMSISINEFNNLDGIANVTDGVPHSSKLSIEGAGILNHTVWNSSIPYMSFKRFENISLPLFTNDGIYGNVEISFRIRCSSNALFNLGILLQGAQWRYYSGDLYEPIPLSSAWSTQEFKIENALLSARIGALDFVCASTDGQPAYVLWDWIRINRPSNADEGNPVLLLSSVETDFSIDNILDMNMDSTKTYLIPDISNTPSEFVDDLIDCAENGGKFIFFGNALGQTDVFGFQLTEPTLLDRIGVMLTTPIGCEGYTLDSTYFQLDQETIAQGYSIENENAEVLAWYNGVSGKRVPMAIKIQIGVGEISVLNINPIIMSSSNTGSNRNIMSSIATLFGIVPNQYDQNITNGDFLPVGVYSLEYPTISNVLAEESLENYLFTFSETNLTGNVAIRSDFGTFVIDDSSSESIQIGFKNGSTLHLTDAMISLRIFGELNISLNSSSAQFSSRSSGDYFSINFPNLTKVWSDFTYSDDISIRIDISTESRNLAISELDVNWIELHGVVKSCEAILKHPEILGLDSTLSAKWMGVLYYNGLVYTPVSIPQTWSIVGSFEIQSIYSSGFSVFYVTMIKDLRIEK